MTLSLANNVSVPKKYSHFLDFFSKKSAAMLFEHSNINKYIINLKPGKKPAYRPIYSLDQVDWKTLKTYMEINFVNEFM